MAIDYKGGACEICGYNRSERALHFHHLDPSQKEFYIGLGSSWEKVKKEIDKCQLVCSNCHMEIHDNNLDRNLQALYEQHRQATVNDMSPELNFYGNLCYYNNV